MKRRLAVLLTAAPLMAGAQDTRTVKEPVRPFTCTVVPAQLTSVADSTLAEADEGRLDTKRIQQAIDGCAPGKAVVLQRANGHAAFLTGPLQLKPGVTLVVDTGVVLFASRDARQYDVTPGACGKLRTEGGRGCKTLITADRANASGVMGPGVIDGRGWAALANDTVTWWEMAEQARDTKYAQNNFRLIHSLRSDDFTLYNLTLRNSPNFHVVLERGNGITAWGVTIRTPKGARNTDGIDPSGSQNVTITKSWIWTGDDNVAIKAGTNGGARNMTVSESHFYNGHGVSIGSETDGGASGILVRDVTFEGTDNALRIKSNGSRGGLVDGVTYENVCIKDVKYPIYMDSHYSASAEKDGANIPQYRNVVVRDVRIVGKGTVMLDGYDAARPLEILLDRVLADAPAGITVKGSNAKVTRGANGSNLVIPATVAQVSGPTTVGARTSALSGCEQRLVPFPGGAPTSLEVRRLAKPGAADAAGTTSADAPATYENPVLFADFSDPDVIRDGEDFWMTASSFAHVPGLPILHSTDLVHWAVVNHAIPRFAAPQFGSAFDAPQHGNGVWAPSIRKHDGWFWIYYGDPDRGIYMTKARDLRGTWSPPLLVQAGKGLIDPSPLWDDDGRAYLVHAYARSRAGIKHRLVVHAMRSDGTALLDTGVVVLLDSLHHPTAEGPKFYKQDGWYWIFAPAGGVATGWQLAMRSRSPRGPYEVRTVMSQGTSAVNGPHQGAWVTLANGESWFLHFQDRGFYGRLVHLQPMEWHADGWPVIGAASATDTVGTPVARWPVPRAGAASAPLQTSDAFTTGTPGLQWQWQANPQPGWFIGDARAGTLTLTAPPLAAGGTNLWSAPNLLLQKLPAEAFTFTAVLSVSGGQAGDIAGLTVFGLDYAWIGVRATAGTAYEVVAAQRRNADAGGPDSVIVLATVERRAASLPLELRATMARGGSVRFAWRVARAQATEPMWTDAPGAFTAREGKWVGAKIGLFASTNRANGPSGTLRLTIDDVRVAPSSR
jgi:beta-xylosidase